LGKRQKTTELDVVLRNFQSENDLGCHNRAVFLRRVLDLHSQLSISNQLGEEELLVE
jgi:hypothetical protein